LEFGKNDTRVYNVLCADAFMYTWFSIVIRIVIMAVCRKTR